MAVNKKKEVKKSRRSKKNIPQGRCYVQAGFGNTIVTITDARGGVVCWSSAGLLGFKGSRKGTPFAAGQAADDAARKASENGVKSIEVFVNGPGAGRDSAIRSLARAGLKVSFMKDITPLPHNGCRPPKRRRV